MSVEYKDTELGKIPLDWDIVSFDTVAELRHGYQFRNYDFTDEGIKILKITQIKGDGTIDLSSCSYIDKDRVAEFERVIINKGDVLVALTGATIGKIAKFNSEELVLQNYRVGNFFPLNEDTLSKDYLFHFLRSKLFFHQILARQTQSAQQNIGKDEISNMLIFLPSNIHEQKAIAAILTAFDDKIELLQAQNKTLETTAQTIFKEWFGKYQIGDELPEGWRVVKLGEVVKIKQGKYVNSEKISEIKTNHCKFPIYGGGGFRGYLSNYIYETPQVVLTCRGNGCGRIQLSEKYSTVTNSCMVLEDENSVLNYEYIYLLTKIVYFESVTSGSAQPQITVTNLAGIEIIIPKEDKLVKFNEIVKPLFQKLGINNSQIQTLKQTRDTLLPKLMSGQLRVDEFKESAVC